VLLISASILTPSLRTMYGSYKLNGAVDSTRAAFAQARARAIEESRPYRVSIEPDGSNYRIAPDHADYWSGSGPADDPQGKGLVLEDALPSGVRFSLGGEMKDLPGDDAETGKASLSPDSYSTTAVFLPDGSAREDVEICFQVRGARPATLQLRGLTGATTVRR
jgi:hypothetical protein